MGIKFYLEPYSQIPPHAQIIDRIKLGLLLGELRPGDTLPSIRDVEKELGVSRNIVRRAYLELESFGILKLKHGKGVIVHTELSYPNDLALAGRSQKLAEETLTRALAAGLAGTSFARMLYQLALERERAQQRFFYVDITESLARERADQISRAWQMTVAGLAMSRIQVLDEIPSDIPLKVFTNHWRYGEVTRLVTHPNADIIPIGLKFTQTMIDEINALRDGATVEIILDEHDFASYGGLILANYQRGFASKKVNFRVRPFTTVEDVKRRLKSGQCQMILISNKLWPDMPASLRRMKMVTHPKMAFDGRSSEQARLRAGIVV
ncbi:MAG: GntR family transcriptional regulator [Acidobacteria bacterium]|nr:MAG: GntR family transcriptional regulator [Acidobacteriota bacterium]